MPNINPATGRRPYNMTNRRKKKVTKKKATKKKATRRGGRPPAFLPGLILSDWTPAQRRQMVTALLADAYNAVPPAPVITPWQHMVAAVENMPVTITEAIHKAMGHDDDDDDDNRPQAVQRYAQYQPR